MTLYNTWREIFEKTGGLLNVNSYCPCNGARACTCKGIGFCESMEAGIVAPINPSDIQMLPTVSTVEHPTASCEVQPSPSNPSCNTSYQVSSSFGSISIDPELCDILLKPQKTSSRKRKRNMDIDPGNKCITSTAFIKALETEKNRKQQLLKEKEDKKREREKKAEEKRLEKERKADLRKKQAEEKEQKKTRQGKKKKGKRKKKKTIIDIYEIGRAHV